MIGSGIFIVFRRHCPHRRFAGAPAGCLAGNSLHDYRRRPQLRRSSGHDAATRRAVRLPARGTPGRSGDFLYGWTLFLVIQTGTIAAVAVAFGKFLGVFFPAISAKKLDLARGTCPGIPWGQWCWATWMWA